MPVSKKQYRYMIALLSNRGLLSNKRAEDKKLKKAFESYIDSKGAKAAGCLVLDDDKILLGKRTDNGLWATPGGSVEPSEHFEEAALRELREEAGIVGKDPVMLMSGRYNGHDSKTYLVENYKGKLKTNGEMVDLKWFHPCDIPWDFLTNYTHDAIKTLVSGKLKKSKDIKWLVAEESLKKNIMRSGSSVPENTIFEVTHGDAVKLVGTGTFRLLKDAVKGMTDESFKEVKLDTYTLHIRKHANDVYSGRVEDGHKTVHQFTNKSLPAVAAELMSVFEWYSPEDGKEVEDLDIDEDAISGGLSSLVDNYKKHNIVNIYQEMENIRQEIRNGNAVDLQQVEQKIMKVFDKLESNLLNVVDKHNQMGKDVGDAVDMIEKKLLELQSKVDEMAKKPVTVDAYASSKVNDKAVHQEYYSYLTRPQVHISPDGHVRIMFGSDWTILDRENFLQDMKAKVVKKAGI